MIEKSIELKILASPTGIEPVRNNYKKIGFLGVTEVMLTIIDVILPQLYDTFPYQNSTKSVPKLTRLLRSTSFVLLYFKPYSK